jgi:HAD superfamily hydrolase (TIGR01509 family)
MNALTPSLIIFDCDGVLIDSEIISADVLVALAARHRVTIDRAYVRNHFQGRSFPTVARIIRDSFAVDLPPDFEANYRAELLARFEADLRPTPGIADVLARLTVPSCVATSSSPPRAARSLAISGFAPFFADRVFTASLVPRGKPAPDLFLHAAARMGHPPERCLVIEDSKPGVEAAQAAGMPVLIYAGASHMAGKVFDTEPKVDAFDDWGVFEALCPWAFRGPA